MHHGASSTTSLLALLMLGSAVGVVVARMRPMMDEGENNYIRVSRDFKEDPVDGEQIPVFYTRVTKSVLGNMPTNRPRPNRAFYARVSRGDESFVRVTKPKPRPTIPAAALDYYGLKQHQLEGHLGSPHVDNRQRIYTQGKDANGRKVDFVCSKDVDDRYWWLRRVLCDQLLARRRRAGEVLDNKEPDFLVLRKYA